MRVFYDKKCEMCEDCRMLLHLGDRKNKKVVMCLDCKSVFEIYPRKKFYISNKLLKNRNRLIF